MLLPIVYIIVKIFRVILVCVSATINEQTNTLTCKSFVHLYVLILYVVVGHKEIPYTHVIQNIIVAFIFNAGINQFKRNRVVHYTFEVCIFGLCILCCFLSFFCFIR